MLCTPLIVIYTNTSDVPIFKPNDKSVKILVFPFQEIQGCEIIDLHVEPVIIERLEEIGRQSGKEIEIRYTDISTISPKSNNAEDLLKKYNADMVIWGSYIESCRNDLELRLEYHTQKELIANDTLSKGDTGFTTISDLSLIQDGVLTERVSSVIFQINKGN
ncbi:MAG: hypothetical protein AAFY76_14800 [Cyanobacteria bacterium J06649_11]